MTGPEHYRKAEACIGWAEGETDRDKRVSLHARAQAHAMLALAAATALNPGMAPGDWLEWIKAATGQQEVTSGRA